MNGITLRQIEMALAVEEAGAICAAAKLVHVAQPSLSQQISALEDAVGTMLFTRTPNGTTPTAAGEAFLKHARHIVDEVESATSASRRAAGTAAAGLRIGVERLGLVDRVAAAVARLRSAEESPSIHEFDNVKVLQEAVRSGQVDVAVGLESGDWEGYRIPLFRLTFGALVASSHPLHGVTNIDVGETVEEKWVVTSATRSILQERAAALGVGASLSFQEVAEFSTVQSLASAGLGLGFLPDNIAPVTPLNPNIEVAVAAYGLTDDESQAAEFLRELRSDSADRDRAFASGSSAA